MDASDICGADMAAVLPPAAAGWCFACANKDGDLKRCKRCLRTWYCSAECQKAAWKSHKKRCRDPPQGQDYFDWLNSSLEQIDESFEKQDWAGVLACEDAVEDMIGGQPPEMSEFLMLQFATAHRGANNHLKAARWYERLIPVLEKLERFRDQGENACNVGNLYIALGSMPDAKVWFEVGRKVGETHGLASIECLACRGLGEVAKQERDIDEAEDFLKRAFQVTSSFTEDELELKEEMESKVLLDLARVFADSKQNNAAEKIALQAIEVGKAKSQRIGASSQEELQALNFAGSFYARNGQPLKAANIMKR